MKKQFIAKLLALGLVLTMLPVTAFAARHTSSTKDDPNAKWDPVNKVYYWYTSDAAPSAGGAGAGTAPMATANSISADGSVEVAVVNGNANAALTDTAIKQMVEQVKDGKMVLEIKATGAGKVRVTLPIQYLAEAAKETGADLVIETPLGTITIPNKVLTRNFTNGRFLDVSVQKTGKEVTVSIKVGGTELKDAKGVKFEA